MRFFRNTGVFRPPWIFQLSCLIWCYSCIIYFLYVYIILAMSFNVVCIQPLLTAAHLCCFLMSLSECFILIHLTGKASGLNPRQGYKPWPRCLLLSLPVTSFIYHLPRLIAYYLYFHSESISAHAHITRLYVPNVSSKQMPAALVSPRVLWVQIISCFLLQSLKQYKSMMRAWHTRSAPGWLSPCTDWQATRRINVVKLSEGLKSRGPFSLIPKGNWGLNLR